MVVVTLPSTGRLTLVVVIPQSDRLTVMTVTLLSGRLTITMWWCVEVQTNMRMDHDKLGLTPKHR